jgi:diguanylate cyclase (GGDEF)-like protein
VNFRAKLRLFFLLLVIVPMIALAIVLFTLTSRSETGKADAGISTGARTAFAVYEDAAKSAVPALRRVASDPQLSAGLEAGADVRGRLRELSRRYGIVEIRLRGPDGALVAQLGSRDGVASKGAPLVAGGERLGTLVVSVTHADELTGRVRRLTGYHVAVFRSRRLLSSTLNGVGSRNALGQRGEPHAFNLGDDEFRGRIEAISEPRRAPLELAVFRDTAGLSDTMARSRLLIGGLLLAFLLLALLAAVTVSRALTHQIDTFLVAARRLARGDFRQPVPVEGSDEFAQLGREFNSMSEQLATTIEEVKRQRGELSEAIRRVGDALATGLDRNGVVALAVRTAVDACEAEAGRARPAEDDSFHGSDWGNDDSELREAMDAAERRAAGARVVSPRRGVTDEDGAPARPPRMATPARVGTAYALAVPMRSVLSAGAEYLGVLSIARRRRAFSHEEEELLQYLAGQAVVSIENASLHETVERQAVTDELTGLANPRAFHTILEGEIERSRRFDVPMALVMLDLDRFKEINDEYGHQQGDEVLARVADVLREFSRDIDSPARYGGDELAVILPQTDADGARQLAERMREAVERLQVPVLNGGNPLKLAASFGVAAMPESASTKDGLVAAADAALYRAKRGGRSRVEQAEPVRAPG